MNLVKLTQRWLAAFALAAIASAPGTSRADISFTMNPVQTTTNAGDFQQVNATTADALNLNQNQALGQNTPILQIVTDTALQIQSPGGGGQSFIQAVSTPFGVVTMTPINPPLVGFTILEVNPFSAPGTTGAFTLTATDQLGFTFTSGTFTFDSNGQNRFAAVAAPGEIITQLVMNVTPPQADVLKQFRLDFVLATEVPELDPGSTASALSLVSGSLLMLTDRRRKRAVI